MTGQNNGEQKPLFERLPATIVPTHYDLTIQPHLDTFKFNGDVQIHLKVCETRLVSNPISNCRLIRSRSRPRASFSMPPNWKWTMPKSSRAPRVGFLLSTSRDTFMDSLSFLQVNRKVSSNTIRKVNVSLSTSKNSSRFASFLLDDRPRCGFSFQKGDYELALTFVGEINNRMRGFYRNKYTTPDGSETRFGASTQFEVGCRAVKVH